MSATVHLMRTRGPFSNTWQSCSASLCTRERSIHRVCQSPPSQGYSRILRACGGRRRRPHKGLALERRAATPIQALATAYGLKHEPSIRGTDIYHNCRPRCPSPPPACVNMAACARHVRTHVRMCVRMCARALTRATHWTDAQPPAWRETLLEGDSLETPLEGYHLEGDPPGFREPQGAPGDSSRAPHTTTMTTPLRGPKNGDDDDDSLLALQERPGASSRGPTHDGVALEGPQSRRRR